MDIRKYISILMMALMTISAAWLGADGTAKDVAVNWVEVDSGPEFEQNRDAFGEPRSPNEGLPSEDTAGDESDKWRQPVYVEDPLSEIDWEQLSETLSQDPDSN